MSTSGVYELPDRRRPGPVVLVTSVGAAAGSRAAAAALACVASEPDRAGLLVDLSQGRAPRPSLISTAGAKALEERLAAHLPDATVASRGAICQLGAAAGESGDGEDDDAALDAVAAAVPTARDSIAALHLPPRLLQPALDDPRIGPSAALLRADLPGDRALTALVAKDLIDRGLRVTVLRHPIGRLCGRAALLGISPLPAKAFSDRLRARLVGSPAGVTRNAG